MTLLGLGQFKTQSTFNIVSDDPIMTHYVTNDGSAGETHVSPSFGLWFFFHFHVQADQNVINIGNYILSDIHHALEVHYWGTEQTICHSKVIIVSVTYAVFP